MATGWARVNSASHFLEANDAAFPLERFRLCSLGHIEWKAGQRQAAIDPSKPMVALAFDDGPGIATQKILDLLTKSGGNATLLIIGRSATAQPDLVRKVIPQGSELGNHTQSHPVLGSVSSRNIPNQLVSASDAIFQAAEVDPLS